DPECPTAVTEIYNLLMKSNSSVAHDIYEEKLKPPDYKEVLLKTAQYAKIVVTCLTEQGLRSLLKASEDLGYTDTGRMFFINIQLPSKHFSDHVPYSRNLLNVRTKPMVQGKLIRDHIKRRVEFLSEANYTKLIQVYDAVFLYASVVQDTYTLLNGNLLHKRESPKVMLERLLNKSSFNSGTTEEMHLSQGRPQIELQVVSYDEGRAKVVFVMGEKEDSQGNEITALHGSYENQGLPRPMHSGNVPHAVPHVPIIHEKAKVKNAMLVQVGQIHWVGGHAPNDQPWGDPDLPQMAVVFVALGAFIFVLIVAFLLIHRPIPEQANYQSLTEAHLLPKQSSYRPVPLRSDPSARRLQANRVPTTSRHKWIKANTIVATPDGDTMDDAPKDLTPLENSNHTYRSTSPSHVRYTLLSPNDLAHPSLAHLR
ncbi:hypothetical protein BIW11_13666, partial [Tropilaelaps mercedesae]